MAHQEDRHHEQHEPDQKQSLTRTPAVPASNALGTTFNDATCALVGGLWQTAVEEGGHGNGDAFNPVAGRPSNDNILGIVQGDAKMQPNAAFSKPVSTTSCWAKPTPWAPR